MLFACNSPSHMAYGTPAPVKWHVCPADASALADLEEHQGWVCMGSINTCPYPSFVLLSHQQLHP